MAKYIIAAINVNYFVHVQVIDCLLSIFAARAEEVIVICFVVFAVSIKCSARTSSSLHH